MVGTIMSIYCGEKPLSNQDMCPRYHGCPARACGHNRSLVQPAEYFCGGAQAMRTFSGTYWEVHFYTTAFQSSCCHFTLEQDCGSKRRRSMKTKPKDGAVMVVGTCYALWAKSRPMQP